MLMVTSTSLSKGSPDSSSKNSLTIEMSNSSILPFLKFITYVSYDVQPFFSSFLAAITKIIFVKLEFLSLLKAIVSPLAIERLLFL